MIKKNSFFFKLLASSVIARSVLVVSLPIIANFVGPSDFGKIGIINAYIAFVLIILSVRVDDFLMKSYYKSNLNQFKKLLFNCISFSSIILIALTTLLLLSNLFFELNYKIFDSYWKFIFAIAYLTVILRFFRVLLRVLEKDNYFIFVDFISVFLKGVFSIIFVVFFFKNWTGYLYALLSLFVIILLMFISFIKKHNLFSYTLDLTHLKNITAYCISLLPIAFLPFLRTGGDKIILSASESMYVIGQYTLAFSFLAVFNLINQVFFNYYTPRLYKTISKEPNEKLVVKLNEVFKFSLIYSAIAILIYFVIKFCINNFMSIEYKEAIMYLPYLIIDAVIFFIYRNLNLYNLYLDKNTFYRKSLYFIVIIEIISMIIFSTNFGVFGIIYTILFFTFLKTIFTLLYKIVSKKFLITFSN